MKRRLTTWFDPGFGGGQWSADLDADPMMVFLDGQPISRSYTWWQPFKTWECNEAGEPERLMIPFADYDPTATVVEAKQAWRNQLLRVADARQSEIMGHVSIGFQPKETAILRTHSDRKKPDWFRMWNGSDMDEHQWRYAAGRLTIKLASHEHPAFHRIEIPAGRYAWSPDYFLGQQCGLYQAGARVYGDKWTNPPAAITASSGQTISGVVVKDAVGVGLRIPDGVRDVVVEGCEFDNIGGSAIVIGPEMLVGNTDKPARNIVIRNCRLKNFGSIFTGAQGIVSLSCAGLTIENCEISDGPYSGITFAWQSPRSGVVVRRNLLRNLGREHNHAMGAIYGTRLKCDALIAENVVEPMLACEESSGGFRASVMLDDKISGCTIERNIVGDSVNPGTGKNTIRDNWNTIAGHEAIAAAAGIYGA